MPVIFAIPSKTSIDELDKLSTIETSKPACSKQLRYEIQYILNLL